MKIMIRGVLVTFVLTVSIFASFMSVQAQTTVTVNTNKFVGANRLEAGIYIGSQDTGAFKSDSEFRDLAEDANVKMVAFMENRLWAVPHPCTSFPDSWNWQGMDTLIQRIFEIGAEPLIALGFWYRSGVWTVDGYKTPTAEEWGAYCAEWVKHFKEVGLPVKYYDIGHETHQYTDSISKLHYCIDLYNGAANSMRAENPDILLATDNNMDVGNSWQVANIQQEYLDKGATFDFLMWHRYLTGSKSTPTSTLIQDSEFHEGGVMGPANWIDPARQNYYNEKGVWLPVIAAGNLNWAYSGGTDPRLQDMVGGVCMALNFKLMMLKGVEYYNVYTFGGSGSSNFGIVDVDTDEPYYPYYVYKMVGPNLGKGDAIVESSSSSTDISTIAWLHDGKLNLLLIHKSTRSQTISLNGVTGHFQYSKIDRKSDFQNGSIDASDIMSLNGYTVMLLSEKSGTPPPPPPPQEYWKLNIASTEGGTTSPSGSIDVLEGSDVSVTANADLGWEFSLWQFDGENVSGTNPITIPTQEVNTSHILVAVFEELLSTRVMHVENIDMSKSGKRNVNCRAVVAIHDVNGNPVAGATVKGVWSGLTNYEQSKVTETDGTATFSCKIQSSSVGEVTFTVENVEKTDWIYDPQANKETSDSIWISTAISKYMHVPQISIPS